MENTSSVVYSKNVLEFVTVAAEYCVFLEQSAGRERAELVDKVLKLLPLLYLKASLLPAVETNENDVTEQLLTEEDYEYIRGTVAQVMGEQDDYLDVFVEDMKYSDTPVRKLISEDLADIYQDLRNFVGIFKMGFEETMVIALAEVHENFKLYWGQTLVNTMRALHDVRYNQQNDENDNPNEDNLNDNDDSIY